MLSDLFHHDPGEWTLIVPQETYTESSEMNIEYKINTPLSVAQFVNLLNDSGLGKRRPVEDPDCMEGVVKNSNLIVTAWNGDSLIGVARAVTDFHYACYVSDLAVSADHKNSGVGKKLLAVTRERLGPKCKLILIAAPGAGTYYDHIGLTNTKDCWYLERTQKLRS